MATGRYHREPGVAGPNNWIRKSISPNQPIITNRWLGPYRGGSGRGPIRAGSRTARRAEYVSGILAGRRAARTGSSLAGFGPGPGGGTPAFRAGLRRVVGIASPAGPNTGSFKTRAGQYVKGRGGRFIGSR